MPARNRSGGAADAPLMAGRWVERHKRWLPRRAPWLADMKPMDGHATAYVCEEFACRAPVTDAEALRAALQT